MSSAYSVVELRGMGSYTMREVRGEIGKPGKGCITEVKKGVSILLEEESIFCIKLSTSHWQPY